MTSHASCALPPEADLAAAAVRGEAGAFEEIVRRHARMVLGISRRLLGSRADAEDLAQEVFLRVHRGLPSFRGASSLKTWITQVTVNAARNRLRGARRAGRHLTSSLDAPVHGDGPTLGATLPADGAGPERLALSAQARLRIEAALAGLPLEFREALVLREIEGLSYEEIASVLGVAVGTVKSRIARARARLQDELRDVAGGGGPP